MSGLPPCPKCLACNGYPVNVWQMWLDAGTDSTTQSLEHIAAHIRRSTASAAGAKRRGNLSIGLRLEQAGPQGGTRRARAAELRSMHGQALGGTREKGKVFQVEGVAYAKAQRKEHAR